MKKHFIQWAIFCGGLVALGCGGSATVSVPTPETKQAPVTTQAASPDSGLDPNSHVVLMETSLGNIKIELDPDKAPATVRNFLSYVDGQFYDGTIFHRVVPQFMIVGGGYHPSLREKLPRPPIKSESDNGLSNERGTIAMYRTEKSSDSARSQFLINVKDNPLFDRDRAEDEVGYCVFGKVIAGMDVVDKIKAVPTATKEGHPNVPVTDVVIKSIRRVKK